MNLDVKIKHIRQLHNLTQSQMADKLFVSFQLISKWERGSSEPSIEMILLMIRTFNLPLNFFLDNDTSPYIESEKDKLMNVFIQIMEQSFEEPPTITELSSISDISVYKINKYFGSLQDIMYEIMNKVDQKIEIEIQSKIKGTNIVDVFINDMTPMLYKNRRILSVMYSRPYIKDLWISFIRVKYTSIISDVASTKNLSSQNINILVEVLIIFISTWMTQSIPESLTDFQKKATHLLNSPVTTWL
jgi:transcriptional regulator with XRE-family HTH domain